MARDLGWVTNWVYSSGLNMQWSLHLGNRGTGKGATGTWKCESWCPASKVWSSEEETSSKGTEQRLFLKSSNNRARGRKQILLKNECLSSELMLMLDVFPLTVCLLVEGKLPVMMVGAFLLMQWWDHGGSQMEGTKLTVCCWIVLCPALNHWSI